MMTDSGIIKATINCQLPGLNDYISALDRGKYIGASLKKEWQRLVAFELKRQIKEPLKPPVHINYYWFEASKRRDKDNISAFGRKIIQDALVDCGILKNDGWAFIDSFSDYFIVDKQKPRVEIEVICIK